MTMAWNIHWQVPFTSLQNAHYMVYIYDRDYSGGVVTLTGSDQPFTTQEKDSDDIFTPIRSQTGYLRVIDETVDGSLMQTLMPDNNTQRMVKLVQGIWNNGVFTPFADDSVKWQGFLAASSYSQDWTNATKMVEFPVNSILESLKYVTMPTTITMERIRMGRVLYYGLSAEYGLGATIDLLSVISDDASQTQWLNRFIDTNALYEWIEVQNDASSVDVLRGRSVYDVLEEMLSLWGLTAREWGPYLFFVQYDNASNVRLCMWDDSAIDDFGNTDTVVVPVATGVDIGVENLLTAFTFAGTNNKTNYIPGANSVKVDFAFSTDSPRLCKLPTADEVQSMTEIQYMKSGRLWIQPLAIRASDEENFVFYRSYVYDEMRDTSPYDLLGRKYITDYFEDSTYEACLAFSIVSKQLPPGVTNQSTPYSYEANETYGNQQTARVTGSFPVRWFFQSDAELVEQRSGLLLSLLPVWAPGSSLEPGRIYIPEDNNVEVPVYELQSANAVSLESGVYLNVKMSLFPILIAAASQPIVTSSGQNNQRNEFYEDNNTTYTIKVMVECGNITLFNDLITFKKNAIVSNHTSGIDTEETDGFFILVPSDMTGKVKITLHDKVRLMPSTSYYQVSTAIVEDLTVTKIYPIGMMASRRTSNTYYKEVLLSGFENEKSISLTVGTFNNNLPGVSFVTAPSDREAYLESLTYRNGQSTYQQRPEVHLLERMAEQYKTIRASFKGVVMAHNILLMTVYNYLSKKFFAIDSKHEWRDGTSTVKYIEVN